MSARSATTATATESATTAANPPTIVSANRRRRPMRSASAVVIPVGRGAEYINARRTYINNSARHPPIGPPDGSVGPQFADALDVPREALPVLGRRLQRQRHVRQRRVVDDPLHPRLADVALTDVRVLVLVRAAGVFRVVEVDVLEVLQPDDVVELRDRLIDRFRRGEVVAGRERVGRVDADVDVGVGAVDDPGEVLELAAELRPPPRRSRSGSS